MWLSNVSVIPIIGNVYFKSSGRNLSLSKYVATPPMLALSIEEIFLYLLKVDRNLRFSKYLLKLFYLNNTFNYKQFH